MSLFSLDNILLNESNSLSTDDYTNYDIANIGYIDHSENCSFVQEGYDFIIEMGKDYMSAEKTLYSDILGSYGDDTIITESFSGFFNKIKDIIKKFIEWLKKVFKEFVAKLNSLFANEKYIKKHHKLLNIFDSEDEFEYNGFEFTHIDDTNAPAANALDAFTGADNGEGYLTTNSGWYTNPDIGMDDANKTLRDTQTTAFNTALDKKLDTLNDGLDDFYEKFRGRVIGRDEKYDSSEYANVLFEFFRNEDDSPSDITIDASYVADAYRRFDKYKDMVKSIEKTQKQMIKDYEDLEKHLTKLIKLNTTDNKLSIDNVINTYSSTQIDVLKKATDGNTNLNDKVIYDKSSVDKMNTYLKVQSSKVSQMCSIHTQAFSAKLEAAKDQFKQDKKIIYKALQKVIKNHSDEKY